MPTGKKKVTRTLSAILSADVKGYSVLMADDEVHTIETLKAYRQIISDLVSKHSGRVVDSPGDNILTEFRSSVDAVECAVKIQKRIEKENSKYDDDKMVQFRIGVNVGDVIQDGGRIYGNGVNVAARIEGLAEPGGVCISRNAYDHIKNKLTLGYEYIGEHVVKNIKDPVRVYKLLMADEDAGKLIGKKTTIPKLKWALAGITTFLLIIVAVIGGLYWKYLYLPAPKNINIDKDITLSLPSGPSIAVLPLDNLTGDPGEDYFCDGFTEHIISTLSYSPKLLVISRSSSFAFRGKPITVQEIGKELNVKWVIEGSIQKSFENLRITVQLIDAISGHHRWSQTYDRELENIFELQDEIAVEIAKELNIELIWGEMARNVFQGVKKSIEYKKLIKAWQYTIKESPLGTEMVRKELQDIIQANPNIPLAYDLLSWTYYHDLWFGKCESTDVCFTKGMDAMKKALALNEDFDSAHLLAGSWFVMKGDFENGIKSIQRAISLNPNNADAYCQLGWVKIYEGHPKTAVNILKKSFILNPIPRLPWNYFVLGFAYQDSKNFEKAIEFYNKALELDPYYWASLVGLIVTYAHLENYDKVKIAQEKLFQAMPDFSPEDFLKTMPYTDEASREFVGEGLRKAGLIE
jgi:adenylate cyclase